MDNEDNLFINDARFEIGMNYLILVSGINPMMFLKRYGKMVVTVRIYKKNATT